MKSLLGVATGLVSWAMMAATAIAQNYAGIATTQVQVLDVYGNVVGQPVYQTQVLVTVRPQLEGGGQVETNPFNLIINPFPEYAGADGATSIASALVSNAVAGDLLIQYWNYAYDPNTATIQGSLVNPANQLAAAYNLINVPSEIAPHIWLPFPLGMATGTQISGTITNTSVDVTISGNTLDLAHPFVSRITANVVTN